MTKKKSAEERERREYAPAGTKSQTRITFMLDNELLTWFKQHKNRSRYINRLIAADMQHTQPMTQLPEA